MLAATLSGIPCEILGHYFGKIADFLGSELTGDLDWKVWKAKNGFAKNKSDFPERYAEALLALKAKGKPKPLLKFYTEQWIFTIIHNYWYGDFEESYFQKEFANQTRQFTLDQQIAGFSAQAEIVEFLKILRNAVHQNRTGGEAEWHRILQRFDRLLEYILTNSIFPRPDLFDKIYLFHNPLDRPWVLQEVVPVFQKANIPIHLETRHFQVSDQLGWNNLVGQCRKTLVLKATNFSKIEKHLVEGYELSERPETVEEKLLVLEPDDLARLAFFAEKLQPQLSAGQPQLPAAPTYPPLAPQHVKIDRLPYGGTHHLLFGRQGELRLLDHAWENHDCNILCFVANGGVGKSLLVNQWIADLAADNYRGAQRVLATSFFSQGTGERVVSADAFIEQSLRWFGQTGFEQRSAWDKGKLLARCVNEHKTLLVLDGLEPLQEGGVVDAGKVKDPALFMLLRELAKSNRGLCIITTRQPLGGFGDKPKGIKTQDLEQLSDEAATHLLRIANIVGDDAALLRAVQNVGNHALAVNLLCTWLHASPGHRAANADGIPDLPEVLEDNGKHPRRVIAALEKLLAEKGKPEAIRLLHLTGLFDRPVQEDLFGRLDDFKNLPAALQELRRYKLVYEENPHAPPGEVDCHPLVREHYAEVLQKTDPERWRQCHAALYEYYKALPEKEFPDTLEEMEPLFSAVAHGCRAGLHQEVEYDVYKNRIRRGNEAYSTNKLGAFGSDLTALSWFFERLWDIPAVGLREDEKAIVIAWAGYRLHALGRLDEAAQPMKACQELFIIEKDWERAAANASNLIELYLTVGDIRQAIFYGMKCVTYADRSGDEFLNELSRATHAGALHQAGDMQKAADRFVEVVRIHQERQPEIQFLYSLQGFMYCDLLLGMGRVEEVLERANFALEISQEQNWLLDIALDHLTLGKAYSQLAQTDPTDMNCENADRYLDQAVEGLRNAGQQQYLPLGLLARAAWHRHTRHYPAAEEDLEEALDIAEPSGMRLHLCDYHLEMARLRLAQERPEDARPHVVETARLIGETGYHRRDGELEELRGAIGER